MRAKDTTLGAEELAKELARVRERGRELSREIQTTADELEEAWRAVAAAVAAGRSETGLEEGRKEARRLEERHQELNAGIRECYRREEAVRDRYERAAFREYGPKAADALQELAKEARKWLSGYRKRWDTFEELDRRAGSGLRRRTKPTPVEKARESIGEHRVAILRQLVYLADALDAPELEGVSPHHESDFGRRPWPQEGGGAAGS